MSTSSSPTARSTRTTAPPTATCSTTARSTSPRFNADGTVEWLPLVHGQGPLTAANGFASQADVLIETRRAADLLGADQDGPARRTSKPNPVTGKVYVDADQQQPAASPSRSTPPTRAPTTASATSSRSTPDGGDHAATEFTWEILLKCGDPAVAEVGATFQRATTENGWFGMPDNCAVDAQGRLWIATDGKRPRPPAAPTASGRSKPKARRAPPRSCFFRVPIGAEMCGPIFHAGRRDALRRRPASRRGGDDGRTSAGRPLEKPSTRWPDFKEGMPPRPSVVAITQKGGGKIARLIAGKKADGG